MRAALTCVLVACASIPLAAQPATVQPPPARTAATARITVDFAAHAFDRTLPFDVPFFITGRAPEGTFKLEVQYAALPESGDATSLSWVPGEPAVWQPGRPSGADDAFLVLMRTPLEPRRAYRFRFVARTADASDTTDTADGATEHKNYVSIDAGLLFAGDLGIGAVYVGSNIYFRPVNKDAPLRNIGGVGRRLALTVGLTVSSIADENEKTRSDLFWNQSLVLGAGYRMTSSLRGGAGALVFRQADPNPLISRKSAAVAWYASFSFDLDLLKGFAG
jgi:hypothetical protein